MEGCFQSSSQELKKGVLSFFLSLCMAYNLISCRKVAVKMHGQLKLTAPQTFELSFRFERDHQDMFFSQKTQAPAKKAEPSM